MEKSWPTFFIDMFHLLGMMDAYEEHYLVPRRSQLGGLCPEDFEALMEQREGADVGAVVPSLTLSVQQTSLQLLCFALQVLTAVPEELLGSSLVISRASS